MKKLFLLLTAMSLSMGMWALNHVPYVDADGTTRYADNVTEITHSSDTLSAGWHVVLGKDVQTGPLVCQGNVYLILADGAKLSAISTDPAGIQVPKGSTLTIYGQTNQNGQLVAQGGNLSSGIGGDMVENGQYIRIYGGDITAMSGYSLIPGIPGIGGGYFNLYNGYVGQNPHV